ncbi:phenylalanyl-tRNA synthetase beta chain [Nitrosomonas sp. Nm51]|uniref:phenylalanine--tRNA ligase subunit beta n=1 Tax=Nitrosomonas sp. Nm51 TaxID=133720 RepID=UPI0008C3A7F0|nr:phenylalanine--tRNA ligase subunit beta [Nitrosomonas sp. Nm51]SER41331.1 phenylalanyl-tRNA synthetase beta chain [Nitrosomonas sp. Nm51]
MKFSENWLRTFVNPSCTSEELAHSLTMAGLEVEAIEPVAASFDKVVVAEVLTVEKHPNADRLRICQVNVGDHAKEPLQIVCGASNVHAGIKVPCALVGAQLQDMEIKSAKLRGIQSSGMLCSARELGVSENADGLLMLPDTAPVGQDFRTYYELNDRVFTLSLTPNRADCLGVYGVAREISALTDTQLVPFKTTPVSPEIEDSLDVRVSAPDACQLYCGRIMRGINSNVETPLWMKQRLERSSLRSINAVVDITNYVLLETGQPMHAFDLAKLDGGIHVRYAKINETIQLLNESRVVLTTDMLLITDDHKPLALAGIMGGLNSGVVQGISDIFLECAFFNPDVISGKSFKLGFNTDSSYRFERGVDFAATRNILEYATNLIQAICGGTAGPVTEKSSVLPPRLPVTVRVDRVQRVLGIMLEKEQIVEYFSRLQFDFSENKNDITVIPPSYRFDLAIEEDFIEELARIHGYDEIPAQVPKSGLEMLPSQESIRTSTQIKQMLVMRDYQEVVNYAFVDKSWETGLIQNKNPVALKNPIANHLDVMRSSLMGGLIANLQFNLNRRQERVRLFELGCCFERSATEHFLQIEKLAGLAYGDVFAEQWGVSARSVDFYDVKSDIEILYQSQEINFQAVQHPAFHPGKSAQIMVGAKPAGWIGELHPRWQRQYDLSHPVILFELLLDSLLPVSLAQIKEIPKYPAVRRDIAVIVDNQMPVQTILSSMYEKKPEIVTEITLFDVYRGKAVGEHNKSLAFKVMLQDAQKTLTDDEAEAAISSLLKILKAKFDAALRN